MYLPPAFRETRPALLHALIRTRPLATLVSQADGLLDANHLPLQLCATERTPLGILRGHVARANPLARDAATAPPEPPVLAIFHGPQAYITPNWYPSKAADGRAVPTWNFVVVHAHGRLRYVEDAAWLEAHLSALSAAQEAAFTPSWQLTDAPADYTRRLMAAVVGIEIEITQLVGKFKLSQNQPPANQAGIIAGLQAQATASARCMADWVAWANAEGGTGASVADAGSHAAAADFPPLPLPETGL